MASGSTIPENAQQHFLECGICLQSFKDPRGLPCLHTFCYGCLRKWVGASEDKSVVICPVCKKKADIPDGDVAGFPAHFMVKNLLETFDKETLYQQKSIQGQHCKIHDERVRYFCKNERKLVCPMCVSEKNCHIDHDRISFKVKDINKQTVIIRELNTVCEKIKIMYEDELKKTTGLQRELQKTKDELTSTLVKIDKAQDQGSSINLASSEQDVIDIFVSLMEVVYQFSKSPPSVADKVSLDHLKLEIGGTVKTTKIVLKKTKEDITDIKQEEWKNSRQLNLPPSFIEPRSIAINQFGDIAITSDEKGVVVLSRNGQVKCYFIKCPKQIVDITVTPDNRFIVPGNNQLLCYGSNGMQLSTIKVAGGLTQTLAVDKCGRIIAYTPGYNNGPWSIHYADGMELSSFSSAKKVPYPLEATYTGEIEYRRWDQALKLYKSVWLIEQVPFRLEATYTGDIVYSRWDKELKLHTSLRLMDYKGGNLRIINPPPQVTSWTPGDVCCSKQNSEIYVANNAQPAGVYKYTAQGDYISCVTTDVNDPAGIALSPDEKELYVVEYGLQLVKIFQRLIV